MIKSIKEFDNLYPTDEACLDLLFSSKYGGWDICPICLSHSKFHKVKKRKCYACQKCGFQVYPLSNTIYHKSSTSLKKWFLAIYLYSKNKKISAKEIQRQIGVTYKTAWRMLNKIRSLREGLIDKPIQLVEVNEAFIKNYVEKLAK